MSEEEPLDELEGISDDPGSLNIDRQLLDSIPPIKRVEAVLFLARESLSSRKLGQLAGLADGTQARTLVRELNRRYDRESRAFNIQAIAGGFQMRSRPQFDTWISRLGNRPETVRLSAPAMETLAVVAYRQPVLKAEIEAIRGVACGELLRQLLDRGMVRIAGRSPELGHPYLYGTTRKFQEEFGLSSLEALPRAKQLREAGLPSMVPPHKNSTPDSATHPLDETGTSHQNQGPSLNP
jgi:segregation and condensation protein B